VSSSSVEQRPTTAVAAAIPGGLVIAVLGALAAFAPAATDGLWWFLAAAAGAALLCVTILALRARVDGVARHALAVAGVGMALFALAHVYTLVDVDTAILLFSVFLVVTAVALIVAGIALARTWRGPGRFVPLLCGVWPLATIPAGAALGDLPHFGAIAVWGLCWVAFGALARSR
jgi:hypothetical protein